MAITISKSRFLAGCQCLKRLYLQVHPPELAHIEEESAEGVISQGHQVGRLARQLFPDGVEVPAQGGLGQAIRITKELVANPDVPVIFEGAFEHKGVIVKTDILQRRERNHWRLVEVKSTTEMKDHHVDDVAIQTYALASSGLKLASSWLAHVNREYVFDGTTLDPRQFFLFRNLTQRVRNLQPEVAIRLRTQFDVLAATTLPDVSPGPQCTRPMICEFFYHCNQPVAKDHIGYLPRLHASAAEQLKEMGIESVNDIPADFELSDIQKRACSAMQTGQPWFSPDLKTELESLQYPLCFMDFETVNPAIPRFFGMHPYDHLPFQWSVHVQRDSGFAPEHFEFLACDNSDPRTAFISSLCEALHEEGSIVVYNGQFESQRLWELSSWLPDYLEPVRAIQRRIWDLLPVVRNHVYHPEFGGSFSLKAVLPALAPKMSYDGMAVANGQAAGLAWEAMIRTNDKGERDAKRRALLTYCGQDTLALVRVLEALRSHCSAKT